MNRITALFIIGILSFNGFGQCPTCGNGIIDAGETYLTCPQDVPRDPTCVSPCGAPTSFESSVGIRQAYDFVGTTTYGASTLPVGWSFAGAPSATTAGALPAADGYGAKAGLVQPNCSGSCTATNGFCIGNLANSVTVGAGGSSGKLGANFDGRLNVSQNSSYAVLRGQGNPTLVSPTFNMSGVEGFKVQFWLFPSETSCGQSNAWGSCVGNVAYLDFSSNGGTNWTQIMQMDISTSNTDMCTNNSTNTKWLNEGSWSRVCLTVYKSTTSPGNFYPAAGASTAPSGIMVNTAFFTSSFKFRIRYAQTASCASGITTTNPGRYLAIDYPVITSGNEMIPCGISFANMCGYGLDDNDDGVGSATTTMTTVFSTVKRSMNNAERGVEIFTSQNASFGSQQATGSTLASNFDLCNAEGGDKQCIDWQSNNNFYSTVYECITDWEAPTGSINVNYYKGTTPQSFGLTKVTASGKTASIGWRYSGSRFVSCGSTSDLNPGCNGYLFQSSSLPTQFSRGFYGLSTNSIGQAWTYYGATSCNNYFSGPVFSPIATPAVTATETDYIACNGADLLFTSDVEFCTSSNFTGNTTIEVTGPSGYAETFNGGTTGTVPITVPGDYTITAQTPNTPVQCLDCSRAVCISVTQADIDACITALPATLNEFYGLDNGISYSLYWSTSTERNLSAFIIEQAEDAVSFSPVGSVPAIGNSETLQKYHYAEIPSQNALTYFRLKMIDQNGEINYSSMIAIEESSENITVLPNPASETLQISGLQGNNTIELIDIRGNILQSSRAEKSNTKMELQCESGMYFLRITNVNGSKSYRIQVQ